MTEPAERNDELLYPEVDRLWWLEAKFVFSRLAPEVWQAIDIMRQRDEDGYFDECEHVVAVPRWIMSYIFEMAAIINNELRKDVLAGKKTEILASQLINALGLTASRFKQAARVERDEEIYWEVLNVVDPRTRSTGTKKDKLDHAYDIVAERRRVKRTTISNLVQSDPPALRAAGAAERHLGRVAELIGTALGYGNGPGRTGILKAARWPNRLGSPHRR